MTTRVSSIPDSAGQVRDKLLKFKQGGQTVEEARAAMISGREAATTTGGGTKVPAFIKEAATRGQGGNTPTDRPETSQEAFLASAKNKIANLRVPPGRRINLVAMQEHGMLTQDEVDALMADANGTVPAPVAAKAESKVEDFLEPEEVTPAVAEPPVVPAEPAVPPARVAAEEGQVRKVETQDFVGSIFRDGKDWVAEIVYKNGAGTERFTANSKDELMTKLLEGKGHGTVKVREVVKERKRQLLYGEENDNWDYFFGKVKESHGLTIEQYLALPEASRQLIQDNIQAVDIIAFQQNWPEYYYSTKNFQLVGKYLNNKKPEPWPLTYRNLEIAYRDLTADEELEKRPAPAVAKIDVAPQATPVSAQSVAPSAEDSAVAAAAPAVTVAPVVRKRGTTGLVPGSSSASNEAPKQPEDGTQQRELSEKELRTMPIKDLAGLAKQGRKYGTRY